MTTSRPITSTPRRWLTGLAVGLAFGAGTLIGGPLVGAMGIVASALLAAEQPRAAGSGGASLGFGASWLALLLTADARCGPDCVGPDLTPWLLVAGATVIIGVGLTASAWRSR